jgi:hypothetical protein
MNEHYLQAHELNVVPLQTCITEYARVLFRNVTGWDIGWFTRYVTIPEFTKLTMED